MVLPKTASIRTENRRHRKAAVKHQIPDRLTAVDRPGRHMRTKHQRRAEPQMKLKHQERPEIQIPPGQTKPMTKAPSAEAGS